MPLTFSHDRQLVRVLAVRKLILRLAIGLKRSTDRLMQSEIRDFFAATVFSYREKLGIALKSLQELMNYRWGKLKAHPDNQTDIIRPSRGRILPVLTSQSPNPVVIRCGSQ